MKKAITAFVILFSAINAFAQINTWSSYQEIEREAIQIRPAGIYGRKESVSEIKSLDEVELSCLIDDDAVGFYRLYEKYPTELQLKNFKTTAEYDTLVSEMKNFKATRIGKGFYLSLKWDYHVSISDYNLQKHGFEICYSHRGGFSEPDGSEMSNDIIPFVRKTIGGINISMLKPQQVIDSWKDENTCFTVPVPEEQALAIEKSEHLDIWFLFDCKTQTKIPYQYKGSSGNVRNTVFTMINPKSIRIAFVDTKTETILYSKTISTSQ